MEGTIKFFDKKKGWGFIKADDNEEYFVYYKQIQMKGYKSLDNDDIVSFEVSEPDGNGRIQATNVQPILTLKMIKDSLKEENLYVKEIKADANTIAMNVLGMDKGYMVVDQNNVIQAGEQGMSFLELAAYAGYEIVEKLA